jgi:hypothetical protein
MKFRIGFAPQVGAVIFSLLLFLHCPLSGAFSGVLKSTTDHYPSHLGKTTGDTIPYLSVEMSDKYRFTKNWRFQWKAFALTNTVSKYSPEKFYGDLPEAFIEFKSGDSRIRTGMNTVNWGVVDVSSPSDVVNTLAVFHPLRTIKQGAPMIDAAFGPEAFKVNLIYIPVQRPPQLPSKDSRWLPRQVLLTVTDQDLGVIQIPKSLEYDYIAPYTFNRALNNNAGAKISSHLGSWDFQITHFDGASSTPKIKPTITLDSAVVLSPILLAPTYYRVRTTGAGFVWAGENLIVRGESAYQHTISRDESLQPWRWSSVLALETNIAVDSTTVTLLAQAYYSKNPQAADNLVASSYRLFDQTGLLGARWAYSEELVLMASALYETPTKGWFALAGFENKLTDHLRWGLSWRNFSAQEEGLIKTFEKNSHASMDLIYYF